MDTLREWAEYYKKMGIWVFPFNRVSFSWDDWRLKKASEYEQDFRRYEWDKAKKILMVAGGTKRKRILVINDLKANNHSYNYQLLKHVLEELCLPQDYPWVIWNKNFMGVIVDTNGDIPGMNSNKVGTKRVRLIWEKSFTVPYPGSTAEFWYGQRPDTEPQQIDSNVLIKCANEFQEKYITPQIIRGTSSKSESEPVPAPKPPIWKTILIYILQVIGLLLLFMLVGALPIVGIPAIIVFFWINWDKVFKKKKK